MGAAAGHQRDVAAGQRQHAAGAVGMQVDRALAHHMQADAAVTREAKRRTRGQVAQVEQAAVQTCLLQQIGEQIHAPGLYAWT